MGDSFTIQISSNLVRHLSDEGEKLKKKTKKSKPKTQRETSSQTKAAVHKDPTSNDPQRAIGGPAPAGWPLQPPLFLPLPSSHSTSAELDSIQSVLKESENVVERLQKQEDNMLQEVTQRAKDLHDKEFQLPLKKPMPCLQEQDDCLKCYKEHLKEPLRCASFVNKYAYCTRRVRATSG